MCVLGYPQVEAAELKGQQSSAAQREAESAQLQEQAQQLQAQVVGLQQQLELQSKEHEQVPSK